ncbi:MAG TPA: glycosyltransferase family 39 protein [Vicinamibacteria bacterium]|nr:glycosyltransferase family 39 protein [Vicinamibacteria bacterium]
MSRGAVLFTGFIVFAALLLRWPIASHDVEHYIGPDEGEVVENVLEMVKTGDFDPRHPGYPGLHFYLQRIPVELRLLIDGRSVAEIPRAEFYLGARRMTLAAGVASAAVVFACGLLFLSPWGAGLAAALTALSSLAFRESAVVNPDLMLGLFVALALLAALRLQESPAPRRYLLAGIVVGLATAVKYTGAFSVVPYAMAATLAHGPKRSRGWALAGLGAALASFAIASPYTFVNLLESARGLERHFGYYRASHMNAALQVLSSLATRGVGLVGALLAVFGAAAALWTREPRRLVVLGYPAVYLLVFAFFDRAYPRHALPLLPAAALLTASFVSRIGGRARWALALVVLAGPAFGSLELWKRAGRPSPADRALAWALSAIPEGSRVLEDQWTPRLDPERFRVHRLRVEEQVFAGNFDWVFYSGYPPGIDVSRLREVRRFPTGDALGAAISVHQVPERAVLMGMTLPEGRSSVELGAGELPYFGEGFDPPRPSAYGTERTSRGESSEIFFVLAAVTEPPDLEIELSLAAAASAVDVAVELNGRPAGVVSVEGLEPETKAMTVRAELLRGGLNRLVLRYGETVRLSRRHREAAVRFYRMRLTRHRSRSRRR